MFVKTSDGLNMYVEERGNLDAAETIVFLNGLTQSTLAWHFMVPFFKQRYRIILLDFVFQGQSDKEGEGRDFDRHAKDVAGVLAYLRIPRVIVTGISYGSLVAQHLAVNRPDLVQALVLLSTFAHKTPYYEAVELSWWRALEEGGYNLMLDIMLPTVLSEEYFSNPVVPLDSLKNMRKGINENREAIFKLMRATRERKDYREELKKIACPTLIVQGEKDMLFPPHLAREVQNNIRDSELKIISHAGHTLNLEHVPEVGKCILDFLKKVK
jgi:3-oxoadipate enol-lactonase